MRTASTEASTIPFRGSFMQSLARLVSASQRTPVLLILVVCAPHTSQVFPNSLPVSEVIGTCDVRGGESITRYELTWCTELRLQQENQHVLH